MSLTAGAEFILSVRKKLNLEQHESAEIFGFSVEEFASYENGKAIPPNSLLNLFRVLDRHPDLLAEVRTLEISTQSEILESGLVSSKGAIAELETGKSQCFTSVNALMADLYSDDGTLMP